MKPTLTAKLFVRIKHYEHRTAQYILKCALSAFHNFKWYIHGCHGDKGEDDQGPRSSLMGEVEEGTSRFGPKEAVSSGWLRNYNSQDIFSF